MSVVVKFERLILFSCYISIKNLAFDVVDEVEVNL